MWNGSVCLTRNLNGPRRKRIPHQEWKEGLETEIVEGIRDEVNAERIREHVRKRAWVRGAYAVAFGFLVLLSGLIFFLYQHAQTQQHSPIRGIEKGRNQEKWHGSKGDGKPQRERIPWSCVFRSERTPASPGADEGSDPSALQERSAPVRGNQTNPRKQVFEVQNRKGAKRLVRRPRSGQPGRLLLNLCAGEKATRRERERSLRIEENPPSEDRSGGLSQTPGSALNLRPRKPRVKDKEEIESGRVFDWLLEKRGDKK